MQAGYSAGAMYARLDEGEHLDISPILLGDGVLAVGEYVQKLGEKARSSFEMRDGWYLKYIGQFGGTLFFCPNTTRKDNPYTWCYAFQYIDKNTLLIGGRHGMMDIRIPKLEKFKKVALHVIAEQVSLF